MAPKAFSIVWRRGGFDNFTWQAALPVLSVEEAAAQLQQVRRAGHRAIVVAHHIGEAPALPATFEPGFLTLEAWQAAQAFELPQVPR